MWRTSPPRPVRDCPTSSHTEGGAQVSVYGERVRHLEHHIVVRVRFVDHEREAFFRCVDCGEDVSAGVREDA